MSHRIELCPTRRSVERAFTVTELAVVMVIIGTLLAIAIPTFGGVRAATDSATVISAAQSYAEAADAFALDHAGRVPALGSADWPTNALVSGPRKPNPDATAATSTYLGRHVPEAVQGGRVAFTSTPVRGGSAPPAAGSAGVIRYVTGPVVAPATVPTSYRVEVWATGSDRRLPTAMTCFLGTYTEAGAERCD